MSQPKVTIVMAVYRPRLNFLNKQLKSINDQTYQNIELIICDDSDCPETTNIIKDIVKMNVPNFPFVIVSNSTNLGSNKTFEKLTEMATGEYISYADQDDIWEEKKIEKLVKVIMDKKGVLAYSDLALINEEDYLISSSFKKKNFRLEHVSGANCFERFLRRNSVTGCTMLIHSEIAKKCVPFPKMSLYPHDHWLALISSLFGNIVYLDEPLIKYRIHSGNQIGNKRFMGIDNLKHYYYERILMQEKRFETVAPFLKLENNKEKQYSFEVEQEFLRARKSYFQEVNVVATINLLKYFKQDYVLVLFEIILGLVPRKLSKLIFKVIKR